MDHDFGEEFDVANNEFVINHLIDDGIVVANHLGTPRTSFNRARVPVLRNADSVLGVRGINPAQRVLLRTVNEVAEVVCLVVHAESCGRRLPQLMQP